MALSGCETLTLAGTPQQLPNSGTTGRGGVWALKAHPDNADTIYLGDQTSAVAATGWPLDPAEAVIVNVPDISKYWWDGDSTGDKICWLKLCGGS